MSECVCSSSRPIPTWARALRIGFAALPRGIRSFVPFLFAGPARPHAAWVPAQCRQQQAPPGPLIVGGRSIPLRTPVDQQPSGGVGGSVARSAMSRHTFSGASPTGRTRGSGLSVIVPGGAVFRGAEGLHFPWRLTPVASISARSAHHNDRVHPRGTCECWRRNAVARRWIATPA
jgi:hypothetical protein